MFILSLSLYLSHSISSLYISYTLTFWFGLGIVQELIAWNTTVSTQKDLPNLGGKTVAWFVWHWPIILKCFAARWRAALEARRFALTARSTHSWQVPLWKFQIVVFGTPSQSQKNSVANTDAFQKGTVFELVMNYIPLFLWCMMCAHFSPPVSFWI